MMIAVMIAESLFNFGETSRRGISSSRLEHETDPTIQLHINGGASITDGIGRVGNRSIMRLENEGVSYSAGISIERTFPGYSWAGNTLSDDDEINPGESDYQTGE